MSAPSSSRSHTVAAAVARRVRRIPGGVQAAGAFAGRLRDSRLARTVVSRVFDIDVTGLSGTVFLAPGNLLGGQGLDNLPVVLVSLVGAEPDDVPGMIESVAQEQVLTGGFRPVLLLDGDHFAEVRQFGYPVEHVTPHASWTDPVTSWDEYLAARLASLRRTYQAVANVDLTCAGPAGLVYLRSFGRS